MTDPRPVVLGVAGGSGSGKSTLVRAVLEGLKAEEVSLIHHDAYYRDYSHLPEKPRAEVNFDHPEALETPLLVEHLQTLLSGDPVEVPVYDFTTHTRTPETVRVEPNLVVVVDGILVLSEPELRQLMDIKVFVDTDPDIRLVRRLERDMRERGRSLESVLHQYTTSVRPMHLEFVEPSKRHADIILPEGGMNRVGVDMLVTKLNSILAGRKIHP